MITLRDLQELTQSYPPDNDQQTLNEDITMMQVEQSRALPLYKGVSFGKEGNDQ